MPNKTYKYRLYPRKAQITELEIVLIGHCELYNAAIQERSDAWKQCHKNISYCDQANQIKEIRAVRNDILQLNFSSLQQTLRKIDKAFQNFFARIKNGYKSGYPRFKSKHRFNSVAFVWKDGIQIKDKQLRIHGVSKTIKVKWHREIPEDAKIKQAVIKREPSGKWHVCFQVELQAKAIAHPSKESVGVDLGLNSFAAFSNSEIIRKPKYFRMMQNKLRKQQRKVSRRKKFSNRWKKACKQVAITHEHAANQRLDFHHKEARKIANRFSFIAVEGLNLSGLQRTKLSKNFNDAGLGNFIRILASKVEETGGELVKVNPAYTSQICPNCGQIKKKELSERWHKCDCGFECDRDVAAAQMILKYARTERSKRNVVDVNDKRALRSPERESSLGFSK